MADQPIIFTDGAAYERMMGIWSRFAGDVFLDWLAPAPGLRWLDVGCGNGAFTQRIVDRCAPASVEGIDPAEPQLAFARSRPAASLANFRAGDAMALPCGDAAFDAAVMALVIFFVPDPARGLAEMVRVTRPGGLIAAYAWDMPGGGFPLEPFHRALTAMGMTYGLTPSAAISRMDALRDLWTAGGLRDVETREITVTRTFADFDELWAISSKGSSVGPAIARLSAAELDDLKAGVRARLPAPAADGRITCSGRANAVKGIRPA